MILLLPGNALGIIRCGIDLDFEHYGWLLSPARTMTKQGTYNLRWAVDNEVFTGRFEEGRFTRALNRIAKAHSMENCLFVVAPDVFADARATLARFERWQPCIREMGYPVALAAQDGLEHLPVPWDSIDVLFVGGSTAWKMSDAAAALMYKARQHGKWVHVGRVSSWQRVDELKVNPDSIDGTHWTKRPDKYIREWNTELEARRRNRCFAFTKDIPYWTPSCTQDST